MYNSDFKKRRFEGQYMKFHEIWIFQLLMNYIFILPKNQGVITNRFETFRYHFPFLYLDEQ